MPAPGPERFNLARHCLGRQAAERGGKTALIIADGPERASAPGPMPSSTGWSGASRAG